MPENKKFWKFCNQVGNTVELLLYGDISQTSWWGDEVTPRQFAEDVKSGEQGVVYLSGEFFADALVLPANGSAADLEVPFRALGIFLK